MEPIQLPTVPVVPVEPTAKEIETTLHTAGQRTINRTWEFTQAFLVIMVSLTALYVSATLSLSETPAVSGAALIALSNAFFLVTGFYFGRSNHTRVGGIGPHDPER